MGKSSNSSLVMSSVQSSVGTVESENKITSKLSSFYSQLFQFQIILVFVQQSLGSHNSNSFCLFISIKAQIFFSVLELYSLILYFVEFQSSSFQFWNIYLQILQCSKTRRLDRCRLEFLFRGFAHLKIGIQIIRLLVIYVGQS